MQMFIVFQIKFKIYNFQMDSLNKQEFKFKLFNLGNHLKYLIVFNLISKPNSNTI